MGTGVRAIVMALFILVLVVSTGKGPELIKLTNRDMGFIILSGIAGALSWLFYFAALKLAEASKVAIVDRASVLVVLVLAAVFLSEKITLRTAIAGVLVFIALLLLT